MQTSISIKTVAYETPKILNKPLINPLKPIKFTAKKEIMNNNKKMFDIVTCICMLEPVIGKKNILVP